MLGSSENHSEIRSLAKALTEPPSTNQEVSSPTSSSHSVDSSSSSSNSLSDEEIEFGQIQLHLRERNIAQATAQTRNALLRLLRRNKESTAPTTTSEFGERNAEAPEVNYPSSEEAKLSGIVRIFNEKKRVFENISKEDAIEVYKKGNEVIIECSNYKKKDARFFMESLKLNAILYWELLTRHTPDKYQRFGSRSTLLIINTATNIEKMIIERAPPIKVVRLAKATLIFTDTPLNLSEILPSTVGHVTGDTLIYLVLQSIIVQSEEIVDELKLLVHKVHEDSFNTENIYQRGTFVETVGELNRLLMYMDKELKVKRELLKEMSRDTTLHMMFRGKVKRLESELKDSEVLLVAANKQFDALVDQETTRVNKKVDTYFKILMLFSVLLGVIDVISTFMGMNVRLPGQDAGNYIPLALVLSISGVICGLLYFALKFFGFIAP